MLKYNKKEKFSLFPHLKKEKNLNYWKKKKDKKQKVKSEKQ